MAISVDEIISSKGYIGWLKSDASPKTRDWWLQIKDGVVILNPEMIATSLEQMKALVDQHIWEWKKILVIYEKSLLREELEQIASKKWIYYLNYKVPGGILTNFDTILKRVKSMNELRQFVESPEFALLTKKEQLTKKRSLAKLEMVYKWIKDLDSKPDLVILLDGMYKPSLLDEVRKSGIPYLVVSSPTLNRNLEDDRVVITNTHSYKALLMVLNYLFS